MKSDLLLCAAVAAMSCLRAQDETPKPMPQPAKVAAHEALAMFAGSWSSVCELQAMPGVPGHEEAQKSTGTERAELVCDGLWLKTSFRGEHDGQPFEGLWLVGYDPQQQKYRGIWVSSMDEPPMECDGGYDAATKTWTFTGATPHGPMRSVTTFADADHFTEVCYLEADGKEVECMRMVRTRQPGAGRAIEAGTPPKKWPSAEHALLAKGLGEWTATVTSTAPGGESAVEQGRERVMPICGGKWFWSDFEGTMMGAPFRGHALTGYDPNAKRYVNFWIDSMSPTHSRCEGTHGAEEKAWTYTGVCTDMAGKPAKIHQTLVQKDDDTRDLQMKFETDDGVHQMRIQYRRKRS
ncbi:MAG: DUF1579 family protein [Planctomycetes bacterium]|nr:DUF1579 family protein [Planctomycetota bacterium]